jgi:hypothetical protein
MQYNDLVIYMIHKYHKYMSGPANIQYINHMIKHNNIHLTKRIFERQPKAYKYLSHESFILAFENGYTNILQILSKSGLNIRNIITAENIRTGIGNAIITDNSDYIKYLKSQDVSVKDYTIGFTFIERLIREENIDMLSECRLTKIYDSQLICDLIKMQSFTIIDWLVNRDLIMWYDVMNYAAKQCYIDILEWGGQYTYTPDQQGAIFATENGHLNVLKYLKRMNISYGIDCMNCAAQNGHIHILTYLQSLGVKLDIHSANLAAGAGQIHVLE